MNKVKSIITNILGLIIWYFAVLELTQDEVSITYVVSLIVVGIVLFRYKFSETKNIINNFINKTSNNVTRTVDPDRNKPDERG